MAESKWNVKLFFKTKLNSKCFLLNLAPAQQAGAQQPRAQRPRAQPDPLWSEVVPARLSAAPPETARLSWPPTKNIGLNSTVLTGWLEDRPELSWAADREAV